MARTTPLINNFTGGELSPLMAGRTDLKGYFFSCRVMKNAHPWPHGPVTRRAGTYYVATCKTPAKKARTISFSYSTEQAYILELGDQYLRVYKDGGQVMSGASPYEISTPYLEADLFAIRTVQSADTMYLVHPSYAPRKLTRTGHTAWTLATVDFAWGPFLDQNTDAAKTLTASALTGTGVTLTAVGHTPFTANHVGSVWKITADKAVATAHSGTGAGTALAAIAGQSVLFHLSGAWAGTVTLERSFDAGATWVAYAAFTANTSFELVSLQATSYRWNCTAHSSGTCDSRLTLLDQSGYVKVTGYTSTSVVTVTVVEDLPTTAAADKWAEGAWSAVRGYPAAVGFFEQRLTAAGSPHQPDTIWASQIDDYENFQTGSLDSDAWAYTLASEQVNAVHWLSRTSALHAGTAGGEWRLASTDAATAITATNPPDARQHTSHGSAKVQAVKIGSAVAFLERAGTQLDRGRRLRTISYDLQSDAYRAPAVSEKASHLLVAGITDMAWAADPMPVLWMVRSDGALVGMTYDEDNGIYAFHEHTTADGTDLFEAVATIPGTDRTEVWVVVKRYVNGAWTRYVEQFQAMLADDGDLADAFYLDCGYTYNSTATTTISGLDHLEGETVDILADGAVHPQRTVDSGAITLARSASKVHVGLAFPARVQTLRLEAGAAAGTAQGKRKKIHRLTVRLHNSLGLKVGADFTTMDEVPFRFGSDPMDAAPPLFTGDIEVALPGSWDKDGYICLANDQPLPFTLVAIGAVETTSDY